MYRWAWARECALNIKTWLRNFNFGFLYSLALFPNDKRTRLATMATTQPIDPELALQCNERFLMFFSFSLTKCLRLIIYQIQNRVLRLQHTHTHTLTIDANEMWVLMPHYMIPFLTINSIWNHSCIEMYTHSHLSILRFLLRFDCLDARNL